MSHLFPLEILEKIFSYLDGISLIRASQVDKTWNREVKRLAMKSDTWRRCVEEIPETNLVELTSNLDLHLSTALPEDLPGANLLQKWHSLYVTWWLWTRISKWATSVVKIKTSRGVSCAKLSGDCIITGHSRGEIRLWNVTGSLLAIARPNRHRILDMLLVSFGTDYEFGNFEWSKIYPRVHLGVAHHCAITTSQDGMLVVTYFVGTYEETEVLKFHRQVYYLEWVVVAARVIPSTSDIFILTQENINFTGRTFKVQQGSDGKLKLIPEKVIVVAGCVRLRTISCYPPKMITLITTVNDREMLFWADLDEFNVSSLTILGQDGQCLQDVITLRANLCIWIENSFTTLLLIYTNNTPEPQKYGVCSILPAVPVCFHLHSTLLFMGTGQGWVLAFDARKLPELDLENPLWTKKLDSGSISHIHTAGRQRELRLVAVSTTGKMYCVEFNTSHCTLLLSVENDSMP